MKTINKILNFVKLTNDFSEIERDIFLSTKQRLENDVEHSYQLTLVSWYIAKIKRLNLDADKVIKYSLIHDLVEVYAGDTPLYSSSSKYINSKEKREKMAGTCLKRNFPEFPELHCYIKKYKEKKDAESKFVYAVDKLLPVLSIYLDEGYAWKTHKITPEMIINKNNLKISSVPSIKRYFDELITLIQKKPEYFIGK